MATVAGHTRFVIFGRRFLWALIAAIVGLVIWIAADNTGSNGKRIVFTNVPQMAEMQNVMENPRYQGLDANNRPYTVIANKAVQVDEDNITLDMVKAEMTQKDGKWVALNSDTGELNVKTKQLELIGHVNLFYDGGYEMVTERAHVDIKESNAYGDSHVAGQGPAGTLEADSFRVFDNGRIIRFDGSVKMRVYGER